MSLTLEVLFVALFFVGTGSVFWGRIMKRYKVEDTWQWTHAQQPSGRLFSLLISQLSIYTLIPDWPPCKQEGIRSMHFLQIDSLKDWSWNRQAVTSCTLSRSLTFGVTRTKCKKGRECRKKALSHNLTIAGVDIQSVLTHLNEKTKRKSVLFSETTGNLCQVNPSLFCIAMPCKPK